ncbi:copper resistance protein CopC [Streptomyces sp. CdTB01]|uniref:copper resistance CopC/CopD family protein n=1 Tax=Streptomyces sp. CdTB01 TaxID=1725411 RepID=UPI001EF09D9C|nr:copper resistance protein CopC [Streptomyces sp. CdTB01]
MPTAARRARTPLTALLLLGTVLALLLGGAGAASAHATLNRSDPADSAVVKTAPKQITLTFSEAVTLSDGSLRVLSPKNLRVDRGPVGHAAGKADTARVTLAGKLPEGTYTVAWRAVSSDSHPISGAFTFSLGQPSATAAVVSAQPAGDTTVSRLYGVFRYAAYGGLALLIGAAVFVLVCLPAAVGLRPVRRLLLTGWTALFASTVVLLLLRGPYETGRGLTAVFDPSLLGNTIVGRTGLALGTRLVLLAAAGVLAARFATRLSAGVRVWGTALAVGLALTWATAEHASAGLQVPLAIPVAVLHLLAMAVWLGGLLALLVALFRAPADQVIPMAAVARYSRLAFTAVVVLVATGLYQSWRQVGSFAALSTTEYGRLLTLKVATVVLVLTAAAFSRQCADRLTHEEDRETLPATTRHPTPVAQTVGVGASCGSDPAGTASATSSGTAEPPSRDQPVAPGPSASDRHRRALRRSVAAEAVLGVVVLAITTLLTGTQPSRAAVASEAAAAAAREPTARVVMVPFDVGTPNGHGSVQLTFAPGRVGDNTVEAVTYGPDKGFVTVPELRLTLTQRAQRIGPLDAKLVDRKGYWATDRLRLPLAGTWTLHVTVRVTDVDQVTVTKDVTIRPSPV